MGKVVNNTLAWAVAYVPVVSLCLIGLIGKRFGPLLHMPGFMLLWLLGPILSVILCLADLANLRRTGVDTRGMAVWAVLLAPAYLFVRAARLRQSNRYAVVWLATFVAALLLAFLFG